MINKHRAVTQMFCSEPLERVENYDKAVSDKEHVWDCHHRGEILPCGNFSMETLKRFGLYWHRPACELIFIRRDEHKRLHNANMTNEWRERASNARTGSKNPFFGKKHTNETRKKISESQIGEKNHNFGKHFSDEHKLRISESQKKRWKDRRKSQ